MQGSDKLDHNRLGAIFADGSVKSDHPHGQRPWRSWTEATRPGRRRIFAIDIRGYPGISGTDR